VEILVDVVRGIFELPVSYINNKFGLAAAWVCAAVMISLIIGLLYVFMTW
jgi:hypothetical protein